MFVSINLHKGVHMHLEISSPGSKADLLQPLCSCIWEYFAAHYQLKLFKLRKKENSFKF